MTLDEAIIYCKEKAKEQENNGCYNCAKDHLQLAKWLKELKQRRSNMFNEKSMSERKWDLLKNLNCKECEYYKGKCNGDMLGYHCEAEQDIEYEQDRAYEMMEER